MSKELIELFVFLRSRCGIPTDIGLFSPLLNLYFKLIPLRTVDQGGVLIFLWPSLIIATTTLINLFCVRSTFLTFITERKKLDRLCSQIDDLQRQRESLNKKLSELNEQSEEKLRLSNLINDIQTQLVQVEEQLKDMESQLAQNNKKIAYRNFVLALLSLIIYLIIYFSADRCYGIIIVPPGSIYPL